MCVSMRVTSVSASWLINKSTTSGQIFSEQRVQSAGLRITLTSTPSHTHTHARGMPCINHFKYICTNFFGFLTLQLSKYHRFCTVVLNLHSCGRQFKVQCAIETPLWVTPAGTRRSLSGEDLKLTHMEIVSEGEAWGESEKRTTELKGKQKKLPERSHKTD